MQKVFVLTALAAAGLTLAVPTPQVGSSITSAAGAVASEATSAVGGVTSDFSSLTSAAASAFESDFPSAVLSIPAPSAIAKALGIDSNSSASSSNASVLMVPSYSNFTSQGWNVRMNAFVYGLPSVDTSKLDDLLHLLGIDNSTLNTTEQGLLANRTTDLASIPIPKASNITVQVALGGDDIGSPLQLEQADDFGEIDQFVVVPGLANAVGNSTQLNETVVAQLYAQNVTGPGNGTTLLVPETGISVVSDIDDVLRVTKVYIPIEGLKNSFAEPYVNLEDTPQVFAEWNRTLPKVAFQ